MVAPIRKRGSGGWSRNLKHSAAVLLPAAEPPTRGAVGRRRLNPGWATDPLSAVFAQKSAVSGQTPAQLTPYLRQPAVACARGVPPAPRGCRLYLIHPAQNYWSFP